MKRGNLNDALADLARHSPAALPEQWKNDVIRRCRDHSAPQPSFVAFGMGQLMAGLAAAVLIGGLAGFFNRHERQPFVEKVTPWSAFSATAPGLPSTLMMIDR